MRNPLIAFDVRAPIAAWRLIVDQQAVLREDAGVVVEEAQVAALGDVPSGFVNKTV